MEGEILRPQDYDAVLFLGENSIDLVEFRLLTPHPNTSGYSSIIYGEPWALMGIMKKEKIATSIDNKRVLKQVANIKGKRTLVVLADLHAIDKNRSMLDLAMIDLRRRIDELNMLNSDLNSKALLHKKFIEDQNLEDTWEEWLVNKLELLKVAQQKTQKPESGQSVSVEVGDQKKKD